MKPFFFSFLFFILLGSPVHAQSSAAAIGTTPAKGPFDTTGFPQWAKDLRRAEIVAFGSFPFTMILATFAVDTYRYAYNNWDRRYAPWPITSGGGIPLTDDEQIIMLTIAAAGSIVISLTDFFIVQYKRQKQRQYFNNLPGGTPIIIRKPLQKEMTDELPSGENPVDPGVP